LDFAIRIFLDLFFIGDCGKFKIGFNSLASTFIFQMKVSRRTLKARLSPDYRAKELGGLAAAAHQILGSAQQTS
jgi:hypothetical protein